jgi:hypothetical protein
VNRHVILASKNSLTDLTSDHRRVDITNLGYILKNYVRSGKAKSTQRLLNQQYFSVVSSPSGKLVTMSELRSNASLDVNPHVQP